MNIYTQINNELIVHSLRPLDKIDNTQFCDLGDHVIADAELPVIKEGQAYLVSGERNDDRHYSVSNNVTVVADYRDIDTYNTESRQLEKTTAIGELPIHLTNQKPPSEYHRFNKRQKKWKLNVAAKKRQLKDAQRITLGKLNEAATATVNELGKLHETPDFERATWTTQAAESIAWHSDKKTATPTLEIIAKMRGVPLDILRRKAYKKAVAFYSLSAAIAGQRQRYRDIIDSSETLKELKGIAFDFKVDV